MATSATIDALDAALRDSGAGVVFHLAAQATVADGYRFARDTFATSVMGTVSLLDAIRDSPTVKAGVIVTIDKCYALAPGGEALRETGPLGGKDPYSASKGCAEIAVAAWRESIFFGGDGAPRIATARAGNVIGGGEWSTHHRLAERLCDDDGARHARSWNFRPAATDHLTVGEVAQRCAGIWGDVAGINRMTLKQIDDYTSRP